MKTSKPALRGGQAGFSAIVVAMVLVLVLSLMTVGFAQLMRREQRSALDKQLSRQAFYAAETGLNDAAKAINGGFSQVKDKCEPYTAAEILAMPASQRTAAGYLGGTSNQVSTATNSSYTCLTIDNAPKSLKFDSIDTEKSKAVMFSGARADDRNVPATIASLVIGWEDTSRTAPFVTSGSTNFTTGVNWLFVPVLRVGLTPLASGCIKRDCLIDSTYTAFMYPTAGSVSNSLATYAPSPYGSYTGKDLAGGIVGGKCNVSSQPRRCNVVITSLGQINFLLVMRSVYKDSAVTIEAYDPAGVQVRLKNAQVVVDSTGKAQDVLRRVQARIPAQNNAEQPATALDTSGDICKQLRLVPESAGSSEDGCEPRPGYLR